ncbi:MAG TPA: sigma-70 family RNA polymerase sigma factor, partial [Solirubrobacterales bacterium]|nr:sigma-70 family RNA polymerase sigma factor [Solirubrobacterales bacterium]
MAATETSTRANAALDDLYRHHVGEVYRYTYAVLGNHADAEDVTQTTFVNALRALERGESPENASAWLIAIAQNVVRQRWRQAASRPAEVELVHDVPETAHEEDIEVDELVRALQRIPPAQREALVMRELEGRSYNEIAGLLGLTTSALETLLFRARRSLAEELENVVTCQNAELAMSKQLDGRLSRKDRRRLDEHLAECPDCARLAEMQKRQRHAFKGLAVLPIPVGLALFKGVPSASAAASLPTIGLGATGTTSNGAAGATGVGVGGATSGGAVAGGSLVAAAVKVAAVIVAATVATGLAYKGVQLAIGESPSSTSASPSATHERTTATGASQKGPTGTKATTLQPARGASPSSGAQHGANAVAGGVAMESETSVVGHVAGGETASDGNTGSANGSGAGATNDGAGSAGDAGSGPAAGSGSGTPAAGAAGTPAAVGTPATGTPSSAPSVSGGGAPGASTTAASAPPKGTTAPAKAKPKKPKVRNPKAAPKPKPKPTPPAAKPTAPPVGPGASNGNGSGNPQPGAGSGNPQPGAGNGSGSPQPGAGNGNGNPQPGAGGTSTGGSHPVTPTPEPTSGSTSESPAPAPAPTTDTSAGEAPT